MKRILLLLVFAKIAKADLVDFTVGVIEKQREQTNVYELPKNARRYESSCSDVIDYGTYDFIVIGAGSAGAVVANRLTEIEEWKVLLVEAGDFGNNATQIPGLFNTLRYSDYNWEYESTPQRAGCLGLIDRICPLPRGRGLGGTTLINNVIYARGHRLDYEKWEAEGNPGWSYEDVLPYFIKSENSQINGDAGFHGEEGPLFVEHPEPPEEQLGAFLKASLEKGYKVVDYNGRKMGGVARIQFNLIDGQRLSTGRAFVNPALRRKNLRVSKNSYATKILIDEKNKSACGVRFNYNGKVYVARARKEVVVSAGAIGSPQLLMLSGIGPKDHLKEKGIETIMDLSVGLNLIDHVKFQGLNVQTNHSVPEVDTKTQAEQYLEGYGPLTDPAGEQGFIFAQTPLEKVADYPDVEIRLTPSPNVDELAIRTTRYTQQTARDLYGKTDPRSALTLTMSLLENRSRGRILLKSKDPFEYPAIDHGIYSEAEDVERIYQGVRMALALLETDGFRRINATLAIEKLEACAEHEHLSKDYWFCVLRQVSVPDNHLMGTCKMGPDPEKGAVVDNRMRVHGFGNLRVADASVVPLSLRNHISAAIVMVGERAADFVKEDHGKI